jgi:hypothetical protein
MTINGCVPVAKLPFLFPGFDKVGDSPSAPWRQFCKKTKVAIIQSNALSLTDAECRDAAVRMSGGVSTRAP